jgi:hypothetical protein
MSIPSSPRAYLYREKYITIQILYTMKIETRVTVPIRKIQRGISLLGSDGGV